MAGVCLEQEIDKNCHVLLLSCQILQLYIIHKRFAGQILCHDVNYCQWLVLEMLRQSPWIKVLEKSGNFISKR